MQILFEKIPHCAFCVFSYTTFSSYVYMYMYIHNCICTCSSHLRVCWVERVFSEERGEGCGLLLGPLALLYLQNEHGPALQQAHCHIHHTYSSSRVSPLTLTTILYMYMNVCMYVQVQAYYIPNLQNFSFVPDILFPLYRGLGGFFLSCTTRQGEWEGE